MVLAGLSYWTITRSWFIIAQLRPGFERALGGEVLIDRARYAGDGRFIIENFSLRSRAHEGVPGEVAVIGRAIVRVDMGTLWSGRPLIHEVVLDDVLLRVSEDAHERGAYTFLGLNPRWERRDDRAPALPPRVEIGRVTIAYGRHDGRDFELRASRAFEGVMDPAPNGSGDEPWYVVLLREVDVSGERPAEEPGIVVRGRWNAVTFENEGEIEGLSLDDRTLAMCPEAVRVWWEEMDLEGRVASAKVEWRGRGDFEVTMQVADVGLTLPVDTDEVLVRYDGGRIVGPSGRQRMNVRNGTIRLNDERLELDLDGDLAGESGETARVPYALKLTIGGLSELKWEEQWMDDVLAVAPFELHLDVQDFHVAPQQNDEERVHGSHPPRRDSSAGAVDLPLQLAQTLEAASITDWTLSMRMRARRTAGGGELETRGQARLSGGAGAHPRFPYRLTGVESIIHFTNDRARIEYLTGIGPSGAVVRLSGEIAPLGRHPGVNLRLNAERVPLDRHLREALNERQRSLYDALVHAPAYESLRDAGLLVDAEAIESMRAERREVAHRIATLAEARDAENAGEAALLELLRLTRREAQLDALIGAGPFELDSAGSARLDMRIHREPGPGMKTLLTGTTIVHEARVLVERFPYPLTVTGGSLAWEEDRIRIIVDEASEGLLFTAPGGGRGVITGHIDRVPPDMLAGFDLHIDVENDAINELVYAAIPLTGAEALDEASCWPGDALSDPAVLLRSVGIEGTLAYAGRVWRETAQRSNVQTPASDEGDDHAASDTRTSQLVGIDYSFDVSLSEGSARPTDELERLISAIGLLWPEGLVLDRVRGELLVTPDRIELVKLSGAHADGRLSAAGVQDLSAAPPRTELDVLFGDLTLGRYLIDLVPSESAELARTLWERYEPGGRFNAHLAYRASGREAEPVRLAVEPIVTHVTIGGEPVSLHMVTEDTSTTQQVNTSIDGGSGSQNSELETRNSPAGGRITLDSGQVRFEDLVLRIMRGERDDGEITLSGSYGMVTGDEALDARGAWVGGRFESPLIGEALALIGAGDHAERYREFDPFGEFDAVFHYASPRRGAKEQYEFAVSPRVIGFQSEGERAVAAMSPSSRVVFTPGFVTLNDFGGTHGRSTFTVNGRVRVDGPPDAVLRVSHTGDLQSLLVRAALPPGVRDVMDGLRFRDGMGTEIDDALLRLAQVGRGGPWRAQFQGDVRLQDASLLAGVPLKEIDGTFSVFAQHEPDEPLVLRIGGEVSRMEALDQELTNVTIDSIHLDEAGTTVHMPMLRGESHGGAMWAQATVGVGEQREYDATIELVSVSLARLVADATEDDPRPARSRLPQAKLYGSLRLAGLRDDPDSRTGRGNVRAMGGSVFGIPLALQIMNILQLIAPLRADLDHADADFYIEGDRLIFERILFESTMGGGLALQLIGDGEMNLDTQEIRTQFRSRSGMLLLRDLAGGLGDQLYQIEVYGPLRNPKARIVPLPGLAPPRAAAGRQAHRSPGQQVNVNE